MVIMERKKLPISIETLNIDEELSKSIDKVTVDDATIEILDDDSLMLIFSFLKHAERVRLERVCKRWRAVSANSWRYIKSLDLNEHKWGLSSRKRSKIINIISFEKVINCCGRYLTCLDLKSVDYCLAPEALMKIVGKFCPNLRVIDVSGVKLSSSGLYSLSKCCHNINKVTMNSFGHSCDEDLAQFFSVNQKLKNLEINNCRSITGKCLDYLSTDLIEHICFFNCPSLDSYYLDDAIVECVCLSSLRISSCPIIGDSTLIAIGKLRTLTKLHIKHHFPNLSSDAMNHISNLVNLRELNVSWNDAVNDEFIINISNSCKELEILNLYSCNVTMRGVESIAELKKLKDLTLTNDNNVNNEDLIRLIEMMPNLCVLEIGCRNASDIIKACVEIIKRRRNNVGFTIYCDENQLDEMSKSIKEMPTELLRICDTMLRYI